MNRVIRSSLAVAALWAVAPAFGQTFVFKGGDRWEVNDPFKMDQAAIPPKPMVDPKKAIIKALDSTVQKTTVQSGVEVVQTRKFSEVERIIWPTSTRLTDAQNNISRGEPGKALDNVEAVIKLFSPLKKVPGSLWPKAAALKLDALERLENDAALSSYLASLEKDGAESIPELETPMKLAQLLQRSRRGEHAGVIRDASELIAKSGEPDTLARLNIIKGNSLLALKKYEEALNTYLRVPVFHGTEVAHVPKALLGAARSFRGMDSPATREQKLQETANRYLREIVVTYPLSKEAEDAKKLLPKEERERAVADQAKLASEPSLPTAEEEPEKPKAETAEGEASPK